MKNNEWTGGKVNWQAPPLPPEFRGRNRALFHEGVFSSETGRETFLAILDTAASEEYPLLSWPAQLKVTTAAVRTSRGPVAFAIWTIHHQGRRLVAYEHLLNPLAPGAVALVESAADQTHLKVLLVNSLQDETVQVAAFTNSFELDKLAAVMRTMREGGPSPSWPAACEEYMRDYRLEDFLTED